MTAPHDERFTTQLHERLHTLAADVDADPDVLDDARARARDAVRRDRWARVGLAAAVVVAVVGAGVGVLRPSVDTPTLDPIAPVDEVPGANGDEARRAAELAELAEERAEAARRAEEQARLRAEGVIPAPMPEVSLAPEDAVGVGTWAAIPAGPIVALTHAAWTGDVLLVGGWCGEAGCPGQLAAYDPSTDTWTELAAPPFAWKHHGDAVWTGTELLVVGGFPTTEDDADAPVVPLVDGGAYDPATDTWRTIDAAPLGARTWHSTVWTGEELLVWGGWHSQWDPAGGEYDVTMHADGAAYDPATDSWRTLAASPLAARAQHGAVWTGERMLVLGGGASDGYESEAYWATEFDDGAAYDPATDTWEHLGDVPGAGPHVTTVWTGEAVLQWNGEGAGYSRNVGDGGVRWDPASGATAPLPNAPTLVVRDSPTLGVWADELGAMVTWGGGCGEGCNAVHGDGALLAGDGSWQLLAEPPIGPRNGHVGAWTGTELLVVGGYQFDMTDDTVPEGTQADGARWRP